MKRIYESPEAEVVLLHSREAIAVVPGTDEGITPMNETDVDQGGSLTENGGVTGGSGRK